MRKMRKTSLRKSRKGNLLMLEKFLSVVLAVCVVASFLTMNVSALNSDEATNAVATEEFPDVDPELPHIGNQYSLKYSWGISGPNGYDKPSDSTRYATMDEAIAAADTTYYPGYEVET